MNDFLQRRILAQPGGALMQILAGLLIALVAVALRFALAPLLGWGAPFIVFFPAVLIASLLTGSLGGGACLVACAISGALFFMAPVGGLPLRREDWMAEGVFLLSAGLVLWVTALFRRSLLDLHASRAQERLMLDELQHRVKNTLAIVQALAAQTLQSSRDPPAFKREFTDRLIALAQAHNLLSEEAWGDVSLHAVVERTLRPFVPDNPERIEVDGEHLSLPPDHVVSLSLCLHELATNATKYGALAHSDGRVHVRWRTFPGPGVSRVQLRWRECDGPPVVPPQRQGFGSRLLRRGLSARAHPKVEMTFAPDGLIWTAEFDLDTPAGHNR